MNIRARNTAVHDVADYCDLKPCNAAFVFSNRESVEQRLGGVLVRAVASVYDRSADHPRKLVRHTRRRVTYHDRIGHHRLEVLSHVNQRFALAD